MIERRSLRFGPDLDMRRDEEADAIRRGNELGRMIREKMERMRKPLWFWEEAVR